MGSIQFSEIEQAAPEMDQLRDRYSQFREELQAAQDEATAVEVMNRWDALRREHGCWISLTHLRFHQDTANAEYKQAREHCDQLTPQLTELDISIKRLLVNHPLRDKIESRIGAQAFALWEAEIPTYEPIIEEDMVTQSTLSARYIELLAAASLELRGETLNLSGIAKYAESPDRELRHEAQLVRCSWFEENQDQLDEIFDNLVSLRHGMARKLGFDNYVELGYLLMQRVDYGQDDVARYRQSVKELVTPLGVELRKWQAAELGIDKVMAWDLAVFFPEGNPLPEGDHDWMIGQAKEMFDEMGGGLDSFFHLLSDGGFMDLKTREGKAGGGFCTSFETVGMPFIYANFNGTRGDVEVFTHEMGHAFQCYMSRKQPWVDYLWPTYESCEIHSMGLEFLTWPHMEKFFGERAEQFRQIHLAGALLFLPYGVAVDHFQHLVYAQPNASAAERHAIWQELEREYLPWMDWGDLPHGSNGGRWQSQRHIYLSPFYYIDYTLAQTCALQFWLRARQDSQQAMDDYVALCRRGGEAPFGELASSAGLVSPFQEGCLRDVIQQARQALPVSV
ncbi:MAG: peptidase M3 [Planctomycetaceae bacterium]|nr:peptidase M3 [Planctomycetaceae bacterium]